MLAWAEVDAGGASSFGLGLRAPPPHCWGAERPSFELLGHILCVGRASRSVGVFPPNPQNTSDFK